MKQEPTHTMMPYPLAKALMDSGMKHYFLGGIFDAIGSVVGAPFKGLAKGLSEQNTYQAQLSPTQQTNYGDYITRSAEDSFRIRQQQQDLANLLAQEARGEGPSVAQQQLAQSTGNAIEANRALMAGQRGAGTNVGLIAKAAGHQAGDQLRGANSDAAMLRAQEMLAARRALAQQQQMMAQGAGSMFGTAGGLQNAQNIGNIENYRMMQGINSGIAQGNVNTINDLSGGLFKGAASAIAGIPLSKGGGGGAGANPGSGAGLGEPGGGAWFAKGGKIPEHIQGIAQILHPEHFERSGGHVPGRSMYSGDDERNDRVPALLSPGEVVLPNSVTQSADPAQKAAEFIRHLQEKKEIRKSGYDRIASRKGKK